MAAMAILTLFLFLLWEHVQDPLDLVLDTRLVFSRLDMGGVCMPCFFFSFSALNSILLYTTLLCIYLQRNLTWTFIRSCYLGLSRLRLDEFFVEFISI
jgi:hypothetical protein